MKIIFLDIDGVLNTYPSRKKWGRDNIDDDQCIQLKRIVQATGAKIVLSSSWRYRFEDKQIVQFKLKKHDIPWVWTDCTPIGIKSDQSTRGDEITSWLDSYQNDLSIIRSAILDDFVVNTPGYPDVRHFLTDDDFGGLTPEIADKVIDYLLNG